jgi:manganese transport protein
VVLSLALPVPMIALVVLSAKPGVMGRFVNSRPLTIAATLATAAVLALNALLVLQMAGVTLPGLG